MKTLIYIDVGTHFGQEFNSLFGSKVDLLLRFFRRIVGYYIFKSGEKITFQNIKNIMKYNNLARQIKKDFLFYFVEANPKIINYSKVYNQADGVFNCAITNSSNTKIASLFLANGEILSQGSSIFKSKKNISTKDVIPTIGMPANLFFSELKKYIDSVVSDYVVILRLNCEGVEDDVIYSVHKTFNDKFLLTLGSLKDVKECKGVIAYKKLENYMRNNSIPFIFFSSSIASWEKAHYSILNVYNKHKNLKLKED